MTLYIEAGFELAELDTLFQLAIVETGGSTFSTTFSTGTRFVRTTAAAASGDFAVQVTGYTSLMGEVATWLNANTGGGAYTVTADTDTNRVTITHDGAGGVTAVSITPTGGAILGLTGVLSGALTHTGQAAPTHTIAASVKCWSEWNEYESDEDISYDVEAHDGSSTGNSKDGVAVYVDLEIPLEPRAAVYTRLAPASTPWTWEAFYRHVRNIHPIALDDDDQTAFLRLRAEGTAFKPRHLNENYLGHFDFRLKTRLLGRL